MRDRLRTLIMENDDLDDLFGDVGDVGDGPSLHIPEPLPKGLLQRVDELALSGCCQYVMNLQRFASISLKIG